MRRRIVTVLVALALLAPAGASAQPGVLPTPAYGNICSTQWGWCPHDPRLMVVVGTHCQCVAYNGQVQYGITRQFPYQSYGRPVDPYFNPHWTDPPPMPVIK